MQYEMPISETLYQGWDKTDGSKLVIWQALGIICAIAIGLGSVNAAFFQQTPSMFVLINSIVQVVVNILIFGVANIGIKHALGQPINYRDMFEPFKFDVLNKLISLYCLQLIIYLVIGLIAVIGYAIEKSGVSSGWVLALPFYLISAILGLIIGLRMALALAFVLDKRLSGLAAIKASFAATENNMLCLLVLFILQSMIVFVSMVPFGIGLIWTLPFVFVTYGVIYKKLLVNWRG